MSCPVCCFLKCQLLAVCCYACSLPRPPPIRTGRETSAPAGPASTSIPEHASAAPVAPARQQSNYQIAAHIPPGYVKTSAELYESPSAVTRAYQRNTYSTSLGESGHLQL
jgi:hypothetical protein